MVDRWNDIGNKLIAMAQDFPEDKYDFKVQKDGGFPDQTAGPISERATILRVTLRNPARRHGGLWSTIA